MCVTGMCVVDCVSATCSGRHYVHCVQWCVGVCVCYVGGWRHGVSGMCIVVLYAGGAWRVVMCRYRDDVQRLCVVMGMFIWSIA